MRVALGGRGAAIALQAAVLGGVAALLIWFGHNIAANLASRHIATGFGYLGRTAGIPIGEPPIPYDPATSTYGRALLVGVVNTLRVAVAGIVLATILGAAVGVARLSGNRLLARICAAYVELVRDVPLLLQLLAWYALLQLLPPARRAWAPLPGVFLSNRGVRLPAPALVPAHGWVLAAALAGGAAAWALHRAGRLAGWRGIAAAAALVLGPAAAVAWLAGVPAPVRLPVLAGFNFRGGIELSPEFAALLGGLVLYTATYISEIVRGGLLAVPRGQVEAAEALGLSRAQVLRFVTLPQALRVMLPPLTSQYLNLTKNSSLAIAIGYQELVSIADTEMNQTGQAIEGVAMIMALYLAISLSISAAMAAYGRERGGGIR